MIRAFVSSTYVDLKEHRACVIGRLTAAGIFVDPMEQWTAASDEPEAPDTARVHTPWFSTGDTRLTGCSL